MDEMLNEESLADISKRRRHKKSARKIRMPVFLTKIGEDVRWYYDIRLWSPLILLLLILALLVPVRQKNAAPTEQAPTVETLPEAEEETVPVPADPQAEALARLAESVGAGRSRNVKTIIMWVAVNRSEDRSNGYGLSLIDEIARPNQWQGYEPNIPYTEETYEIAKDVLETIQSGGLRPLDSDMLWLVLNDNGSVTVRNQFTNSNNQRWREKTVY